MVPDRVLQVNAYLSTRGVGGALDTNDTPSARYRLGDGESVHVVGRKP